MIYTVTFNPSIDYIIFTDGFEISGLNRAKATYKFAGGKGINVSRVLKRLDIENTATGFIGGFTGRFIEDVLTSEAISTNFVTVDQDTRINVKIKADQETEINGNGPEVTEAQLQELLSILSSLTADDVVVFAGSAPSSLGNAVYKQLIAASRATGAQVVCDFEGQTLIDSLEFNPQLVKPNNHELGDIFGVTLTELLKFLVIAGILTIAGISFLQGNIGVTAGFLFININYVINLFDLMANLSRQFPNIRRSLETGSRVLAFLDQPLEADGASELKIEKAQVVFNDVQFAYEEGKPVLRDIAFQASPGQTIALVGHTGSGKSSIMNLLYRFYDPQEGAILIDGQDIRQVSRESLRSHMGIVLQDPYLFTGTIASNVAMSQEHIDREAVQDALKKVGASYVITDIVVTKES